MMPNPNAIHEAHPAGVANPDDLAAGAGHSDFVEDDEFLGAWLEHTIDALEREDPIFLKRTELRRWAAAAGFEDVDVRHFVELDVWEMRFRRGTNVECANLAQAERWLGVIARDCRCQFVSGQFIAIVEGDEVAARFRLQPREQAV